MYPPITARSDTSGFLRNSRSWSRPMQPFSISVAVPGSPHNAPDSQLTHSGEDRGGARRSALSCCSGAHLVQEIGTTQVLDVRTSATPGAAKALALPARHRLLTQNQRYDNPVNSLQALSQCRSWQEPCGFSAMFPNQSMECPTNSSGMPSTRRAQGWPAELFGTRAQPWIEGVPHRVPRQVDAQHQNPQRDPGEQNCPRCHFHVGPVLAQHRSQ